VRDAGRLRQASMTLQAWLALSNLLSEPATLGRYTLDGPRSAALQRLRRLLNEVHHMHTQADVGPLLEYP
jgi:hypothetical protein